MEISAQTTAFLPVSASASTRSQDGEAASRDNDLRAAADGFESLFVTMMLKSARQSGFEDTLTGGNGVEMAQSMFDMKVAEVTAGRSNLGISQAVYRQFAGPTRE